MRQGLKLVHFSAQPKPFWSHLPVSPCLIDWVKIMHPTYPTKYAYMGRKVDDCKPLQCGFLRSKCGLPRGRGLHSSTFQLNLSRFWHKSIP